jgi:hypothetical protein
MDEGTCDECRMVWVEYFILETKLGTSEWDLSPLSCSLGFVNSKPSKLCAQELNKQIPKYPR